MEKLGSNTANETAKLVSSVTKIKKAPLLECYETA